MTLGLIAAIVIAFFSMFIPGILLALGLLRRTELHMFEIVVIGFIFGLIAPATLTWLEGYLITYVHAFTFSLWLFELNALALTIVGIVLCYFEGVFSDLMPYIAGKSASSKSDGTSASLEELRHRLSKFSHGKDIVHKHVQEYNDLRSRHNSETSSASKLSDDERSKITALHRETEENLHQSQLREERLLLQDFEGQAKHRAASSSQYKPPWWVWALLLVLMLVTFYTRMQSIVIAPKFFEFDPYFDMIDAHYILTYGKQLLLDPSAWPVVAAGTNHRLQPLVPYIESYWYSLVNALQYHHIAFSTNLMSYVGSIYPPITAALLVFVIFLLLYHEYDERIGLIGASLTAMMPVLFTTFVAGEQLVEPWGIFSLFFFFATYMLAIRNMKDKRLAILAGIAFSSTFLGAHYYTVTAGVLVLYIIIQGVLDIARNESLKDFYKMNIIVLATIIIFYALYAPYQATLQSNLSSILGIPIVISGPLLALAFIAFLDFIPKLLAKRKIIIKEVNLRANLEFMAAVTIILILAILFTPLGKPIKSYVNLSARFTTASKPLFMTVQEYIPTGLIYDFGSQGFGAIGVGLFNIPYLVWIICAMGLGLLCISIIYRRSKTGVLYIAAAVPLMAAGFLEVKYLPHFGAAYIMLFGIILGEILYLAESNFKLIKSASNTDETKARYSMNVYNEHPLAAQSVLLIGLYFIFGLFFAVLALIYIIIYRYLIKKSKDKYNQWLVVLCIALILFSLTSQMLLYGENTALVESILAQFTYLANPSNACTILSNNGNQIGYNIYCNTIPTYWLNSMSWIRANVGPNAPRVLAWWDYGDWINWFGNSNAVLRGDNSVASEDYAVAAQYVLGPKYNTTPSTLASYMNGNQTKYVLFDQDLISKWGALDFLGCININATSMAYAVAQGQSQNPPVPFLLGSSQCELSHDPEFALVPYSAFVQTANTSQQSISNYCSISNTKGTYVRSFLLIGSSLENSSVCVSTVPNINGVLSIYSTNGTKLNAVLQSTEYQGVEDIPGSGPYIEFIVIYLPGANGTVANAPSDFYNSNYYRGFFLGNLPGFKEVYPSNATGINFVNGTYPIRIYEVNNYTGGLPLVPQKAPWIHNNDTMP